MNKKSLLWTLVLLTHALFAAGCPGGGGHSNAPETHELSVSLGSLPAGVETTRCMNVRVPVVERSMIRRIRVQPGASAARVMLYRSSSTDETVAPFACETGRDFTNSVPGAVLHPIFFAKQGVTELNFPLSDGSHGTKAGAEVGPAIDADQMIQVEVHGVNASPDPIELTVRIELDTIEFPADGVESDMGLVGTAQINIGPLAAASSGIKFQRLPSDIAIFAAIAQQSLYGTETRAWHTDGASGAATASLALSSTDPSMPTLAKFSPPLRSSATATGLAYECSWTNTSASSVAFGLSQNDETCFVWHYHFPAKGFDYCIDGICNFPGEYL